MFLKPNFQNLNQFRTPLNWGWSISDSKIRHWPLVTKMFCRDVRASSCSVNTAVVFKAIYWWVPHSYGLKYKSLWHKRSLAAPQMCNFFFFPLCSLLRPVVTGEASDIFFICDRLDAKRRWQRSITATLTPLRCCLGCFLWHISRRAKGNGKRESEVGGAFWLEMTSLFIILLSCHFS